jgi:hypothetical protein
VPPIVPPDGPWLENDLAHSLDLAGPWQFSLAGEPFREIPVPSAWEAHTSDKITDGPAVYRRAFVLPADWPAARHVVLEFGAVSFECTVRLNGAAAGGHRGMWSAFQLDVTQLIRPGENTLEVEVFKPGTHHPPRQSLSGFLPDVATTFGGIWQGVRLVAFDAAIADLRFYNFSLVDESLGVGGAVAGAVSDDPLAILVELFNADGAVMRSTLKEPSSRSDRFACSLEQGGLPRWIPGDPNLFAATVSVFEGDRVVAQAMRTIGIRDVASVNGRTLIDGRPLHLRGVLDWGWHPDIIRPAPNRAQLLTQFEQARRLGFNLIKLCLFVPDEATFQAADEAGMYLWLEMPLWLPHLTPEVRALALAEYAAVFRRLHHHPSIVVLSLGCELNAEADREFLRALSDLARSYFPNTLHVDNSGSAEAYGGVATAPSDFYDYHFYTDPHFFQPLVEHFDRGYRPARPWLFGEFCDADTMRDFNRLQPEPWWLHEPVALDRDDFLYTRDYRRRLAEAGITDGGAELTRIARKQATEVRKCILEQSRLHDATGGYVVSGWTDTPITTSGIVDDGGELKFEPQEWRRFNADAVLLLDRERRRTWERGGDRPAYRDPFSWRPDERPELHIILSNGFADTAGGKLLWSLTDHDGADLDRGTLSVPPVRGGEVGELGTIFPAIKLPPLTAPAECRLSVEVELSLPNGRSFSIQNEWPLWVVPRARLTREISPDAPRLVEALSAELLEWVRAGGRAVWWLTEPASETRGLPFWREAIHVFEPHPLWERVPQPGWADMRFFSVATDLAIDLAGLEASLPGGRVRPVWRRFDARAMTWAEYIVEVQCGAGRIWATSLRFAGGLGRQPAGLGANPWGAWLLRCLLDA